MKTFPIPLTTFRAWLLHIGVSGDTVHSYEQLLDRYKRYCHKEQIEPEQATYNELLSFIGHLQEQELTAGSIQQYVGVLKHYYNWLIHLNLREDNPAGVIVIRGRKKRKLHHIIPQADLEQLYHTIQLFRSSESDSGQVWYKSAELGAKRNKIILGLMIWQGLAAGELMALRLSDIHLYEGTITIPGSRKTNERTLKLESFQILELLEYTHQTRPELLGLSGQITDQLIVTHSNGASLHNVMAKLMTKLTAHNPRITSLKQIRASVITHWLKQHNLRQVQYMAGHRYVSSTEAYQLNDMEDLKTDIDKFHPLG